MNKKLKHFILFFSVVHSLVILAQQKTGAPFVLPELNAVTLDSTNLPIVAIYTSFQSIPDEPKITADMAIIDKGYNLYNKPTDTNYTYYGKIGIEKRGSISQLWSQNSYAVETRDSLGNSLNFPIMGMPAENDWVLYGPYNEYTLLKNTLTYELARKMGYWAPRTKYCELILNTFINWNYKGVYVMMEKVKRDKNRVDISKLDSLDNSGDDLTGGYIFAVDKNIWAADSGWYSSYDNGVYFTYKYPEADEITIQQKYYIQSYVDSFETALQGPNFTNPQTGYRKYIEPPTFMDFFFIQELSKNIDAFKRSSYLTKDKDSKGGKLKAGPHWDYNSAWNLHYCGFDTVPGWTYTMTCPINQSYHVPFWWSKLLQDTVYANEMKCRWIQHRTNTLDTAVIFHVIDSVANYIKEASVRHFTQFNFGANFQNQVDSLKDWIALRLNWMDANMYGNCWNVSTDDIEKLSDVVVFPNPATDKITIQYNISEKTKNINFELYSIVGQKIKSKQLISTNTAEIIDVSDLSPGAYLYKVSCDDICVKSDKIIVVK